MISSFIKKIPRGVLLLISIMLFVFVLPQVASIDRAAIVPELFYTFLLFSISISIEKREIWFRVFISLSVFMIWLMFYMDSHAVKYIAFSFTVLVYILAVVKMVVQIIKQKEVDTRLILETINGYLLIGVIISLLNVMILWYNPQAISFGSKSNVFSVSDIIYFSYINMTSVGFGEIIPVSNIAKSISIISVVTGQLYLAIIMAFIIGKFLNSRHK